MCIYLLFFRVVSIIGYYKILNIVPCTYYTVYPCVYNNNVHLLISNSEFIPFFIFLSVTTRTFKITYGAPIILLLDSTSLGKEEKGEETEEKRVEGRGLLLDSERKFSFS